MTLCAYCGYPTRGAWCGHHANAPDEPNWATGNRIMCDFVHRGIVAPALPSCDYELSSPIENVR